MLFPEGVLINGQTGSVTPETGRYTKKLSELKGIFNDTSAYERAIAERGDPIIYEVIDYRKQDSDLCFGTTIMSPGKIGHEYYMTRGHFHERRACSEIYYTQSGEGLLLLESRDGETCTVNMRPNSCAFIPPDWAHRSINVGHDKLVFAWFCATDAGHDYGTILERGMRKLVFEHNEMVSIVDNPNFQA